MAVLAVGSGCALFLADRRSRGQTPSPASIPAQWIWYRFSCEIRRTNMTRISARAVARRALIGVALLAVTLSAPPAGALEEQKGEAAGLDACDQRLCHMLQQRTPAGEDLKCALSKTWARSTLKEADRIDLTWAFGDARCSIELNVSRASIVAAVTSSK